MRSEEVFLKADDGIDLFLRRFEPETGSGDRTLFVVHGMSEHSQRYEHVARSAASRGWNVVVPDLRGHGRSGGEPTHVGDFLEYVGDLKRTFEWAGARPENTVIAGHSMGGLISARFVQQHPDCVSAMALLSPLLGIEIEIPPLKIALGKFLSLVRPRSRFQRDPEPDYTTRNREFLAERAQDPFIRNTVTAAWYFAMQSALRTAWKHAHAVTCPILILQAGTDLIVDSSAAEPWLAQVGSADKTLRIFPSHYHALLNEPDWPQTLGQLLDWLEQRLPAAAPTCDTVLPERLDVPQSDGEIEAVDRAR